MPPRPPLTSLVIHTWKEHGKPRPLSNHQQSTQAARDRISRSLSYDAQLTKSVRNLSEDDVLTNTHRIPAVMTSTSIEERPHTSKSTPVRSSSPVSTSTDDAFDSPLSRAPLLPMCISTPENVQTSIRQAAIIQKKTNPENGLSQNHLALPPRPLEWPLCNTKTRHDGRAMLLASSSARKARRFRARSVDATRTFGSSLLGDSLIQPSSSLDAGLSCIATRGITQTANSRKF